MPDATTPEETELRIQLAEMRTDKKFAEMVGEMRAGFAELDGRIDRLADRVGALERSIAGVKPTVIATGIAAVAVVAAMMSYGQTWFGISTRDVVKAAVTEYRAQTRDAAQPP